MKHRHIFIDAIVKLCNCYGHCPYEIICYIHPIKIHTKNTITDLNVYGWLNIYDVIVEAVLCLKQYLNTKQNPFLVNWNEANV